MGKGKFLLMTDEMYAKIEKWTKILRKSNNNMLFSTELMKKRQKFLKINLISFRKNKKGPLGPFKFQKVIYEMLCRAFIK